MTRYWWIAILALLLFGCSALGGGPESAARAEFEKWAIEKVTPYKNVQVSAKTDEPFAKVKVIAEFKQNPDSPWVEQEAAVDCRKVGQEWQCGKNSPFNKTARFIASENATAQAKASMVAATAQAQAIVATATAQAKVVAATAIWTSLGVPKERVTDGVPMMFVPAGKFLMGSDADKLVFYYEKPQHTVYLDAFWIDKHEVTNALYKKCVDAGKCSAPRESKSYTRRSYYGNAQYDNYPVINVNWDDATKYCVFAKKQLPSEAQWEKAASGTDKRIYPWGDTFDKNLVNSSSEDRRGDTTAVGSYPNGASPYGAMDMAGNVWEWVADWYDANYYKNSPARNPKNETSGQYRVVRGGSWDANASGVRAANRSNVNPDYWSDFGGFRCVE